MDDDDFLMTTAMYRWCLVWTTQNNISEWEGALVLNYKKEKVKCLYVDLDQRSPCQTTFCYKNKQTERYVSSVNENCNNAWWPLGAATFKSGNINFNINKVLTQG